MERAGVAREKMTAAQMVLNEKKVEEKVQRQTIGREWNTAQQAYQKNQARYEVGHQSNQ